MNLPVSYNLHQVAEQFGCSYQSVKKLIDKGVLKAFKAGGWRVTENALLEYIEYNQCQNAIVKTGLQNIRALKYSNSNHAIKTNGAKNCLQQIDNLRNMSK